MYQEPSLHAIDAVSGSLTDSAGCYVKRVSDLVGIYGDKDEFARIARRQGDEIAYSVSDLGRSLASGDLIYGTTWMAAGRIGGEFFMTRGHIHSKPDRSETYAGLSGRGVLLLESPAGDVRTLEIAAGIVVYVPPYWIHRSVNTGDCPLVMSFCFPADAGQDYGIIERSNGMKVRVMADGDGWRCVENEDYRFRSAQEIARFSQ